MAASMLEKVAGCLLKPPQQGAIRGLCSQLKQLSVQNNATGLGHLSSRSLTTTPNWQQGGISSTGITSHLVPATTRPLLQSTLPVINSCRTKIRVSVEDGKPVGVKEVPERFYRLDWGIWIRPRAGWIQRPDTRTYSTTVNDCTPKDQSGNRTRHVALKLAYLGWGYHGYAIQPGSETTVEGALFSALIEAQLIVSRQTCNYRRCGRTDKGVSAYGQVVSLELRTNIQRSLGDQDKTEHKDEISYASVLNRLLPHDIRVLAWAPVSPTFNLQDECKARVYKYYFPCGDLDIPAMQEAVKKLVGEHDFRNMCKMDVRHGVKDFRRKIISADITMDTESKDGFTMCKMKIVAESFLWHQIRFMATLLVLIGRNREKPEILDELLDVKKTPGRPTYHTASAIPLVLFDNEFHEDLDWVYEPEQRERTIKQLQSMWTQHAVRAAMLKEMAEDLSRTSNTTGVKEDIKAASQFQTDWLVQGSRSKKRISILDSPRAATFEEKLESCNRKSRQKDQGKEEANKT